MISLPLTIALLPFFMSLYLLSHCATALTPTPYLRTNAPNCWDDPVKFTPMIYKDCIDIINHDITFGYDPNELLKFSIDPRHHPDIQLPKYWKRRDAKCGVGLDFAPQLGEYDRTTLRDVQQAAQAIAVECIIGNQHLGGYVQLGWHNRLGVLITGKRHPVLVGERVNGTVEEI